MHSDYGGEPKEERVVLRQGVTEEDVIDHAIAQEWRFLRSHPGAPGTHPQHVWATDARDATVFYLTDEGLGFSYLDVESADPAAVRRVLDAVTAQPDGLPAYTDGEVFARFEAARSGPADPGDEEAEGERIQSVYLAALVSPPQADPRFLSLLERSAADPSPRVRWAALRAVSEVGWPELRPLVERLRERDPDGRVRSAAERLLGLMDRKFGPAPAA